MQPTLLSAHISYSVTPLPHSALRTHGFIFEPDVFVIRRRASIALEGDRPVIGNVKLGSDRRRAFDIGPEVRQATKVSNLD